MKATPFNPGRLAAPPALTLLLAGWCGTLCAAPPAPVIAADSLRRHVEFLASDELEGRAAGTAGYRQAAEYVAREFASIGLSPGGENASWYQDVPLLESHSVVEESLARLQHGATAVDLVPAQDFLARAQFVEPSATVTAPAVFAGHGIQAPGMHYDDYAHVDVRGRIAVIMTGAPPRFPHNERAYYSSTSYKYATLVRHGAVGVIFIDTPADEARRPFARAVQQSWMPSMRWHENGVPFEAFPELRGKFFFSRAGAEKLFAGAPRPLRQVFGRSIRGKSQGFELPVTVTLGTRSRLGRLSSTNVVGVLEGSDPKLKSEFIVYTAHLDHVGKGAAVQGDAIYNGALDNASGIAILVEMARAFAQLPGRPRRSIVFLAVTAEERGLLGSDYFARRPTVPAGGIVANINMDMPIAFTAIEDLIAFGAEHSTLGALAARAARREGMRLSPDPMPEEVSFVRSDQYSFVRQGIPALDISTGLRARERGIDARKLVADFLANRYHMPGDDASQPIHYETLATLGRVNARIGLEVANADERPRWLRGDFFGEQFGAQREAALAAAAN
jgi:hypothetical protein